MWRLRTSGSVCSLFLSSFYTLVLVQWIWAHLLPTSPWMAQVFMLKTSIVNTKKYVHRIYVTCWKLSCLLFFFSHVDWALPLRINCSKEKRRMSGRMSKILSQNIPTLLRTSPERIGGCLFSLLDVFCIVHWRKIDKLQDILKDTLSVSGGNSMSKVFKLS